MYKVALALTAATAFLAPAGGSAQAAQMGTSNSFAGVIAPNNVVKVQYFHWHGHRYCFYWDGWNGAGWYRCGYSRNHGHGWGGPSGWHGWHHGGKGGKGGKYGGKGGKNVVKGFAPGATEKMKQKYGKPKFTPAVPGASMGGKVKQQYKMK